MYPKHDEDFYGWTMGNAKAIAEKRFNEVDYEHLIEELEDMGASRERELINRLKILIAHLLKWQYQPTHRPWDISGKSWTLTIKEQRNEILLHLKKNPGLKPLITQAVCDAYPSAVMKAARETNIEDKDFPTECPYSFEQIMNGEYFPD